MGNPVPGGAGRVVLVCALYAASALAFSCGMVVLSASGSVRIGTARMVAFGATVLLTCIGGLVLMGLYARRSRTGSAPALVAALWGALCGVLVLLLHDRLVAAGFSSAGRGGVLFIGITVASGVVVGLSLLWAALRARRGRTAAPARPGD